MCPIRILVADDHVVVREGTRQILERDPEIKVVAEAGNGREAVNLAAREQPDVAIVDVSMPVMNGIEATREMMKVAPNARVLVLTAYDDDEYVFAILEAGAAGYVLKNARGTDLIEAVRRVYAGESVLDPGVVSKVVHRATSPPPRSEGATANLLSEREIQVLRLAAEGLSNRQIAQRLVLSPRTVQAHMANIFAKLEVSSRTEAVMAALRQRLIRLDDIPS